MERTEVLAKIEEAAREGRTELDLSRSGISQLPEQIGRLEGLGILWLHDNQLTSLPESIGQLTDLSTLNLSGNQLTSLPESVGQLVNLWVLDLRDNGLIALPKSIGRLANLRALFFNGNQLTSLPGSVGHLSSLERLYLDGNQLTSLPDSIGQLARLKRLDLSRNQLTELPDSLGQLNRLEELRLFGNRLSSLPGSIGRLNRLEELDLSRNQLSSLPGSLGHLYSLRLIGLEENPLHYALRGALSLGMDELMAYLRSLPDARALHVFLCHSKGDKAVVRDLYQRLQAEAYVDPWFDEEKLLPGQDWDLEIAEAIRGSHVVVVCLSQDSVTKEGYVQKEVRRALDVAEEKPEGTIFLIPVRLEGCRVPHRLRRWQWVDLFADGGYEKLVAALQARAAGLAGRGVGGGG